MSNLSLISFQIRRGDGVQHIQSNYRPAYILQGHQLNRNKIYYNSTSANATQRLGCDNENMNLDSYANLSPSSYTEYQAPNNTTVITGGISLPNRFVPGIGSANQHVQLLPDIMEPEYHQLGVRIQHLSVRIRDTIVTNPNGCCIYYGRFDEVFTVFLTNVSYRSAHLLLLILLKHKFHTKSQ